MRRKQRPVGKATMRAPAPKELSGLAVCFPDDQPAALAAGPHLGLVWQRFLPAYHPRRFEKKPPDDVARWFHGDLVDWFIRLAGHGNHAAEACVRAHQQRRVRLAPLQPLWLQLTTETRLVTGVAEPSAVEGGGLALHHTWGFPVIRGSSLKGLARHYLSEELKEPGAPAQALQDVKNWLEALGYAPKAKPTGAKLAGRLFGAGGADGGPEGAVAFHDAWIEPALNCGAGGWFARDVLTPHHTKYYGEAEPAANDRDAPIPVQLLAVERDQVFRLPLALTGVGERTAGTERAVVLGLVAEVLRQAADRWGACARSGAGWGRLRVEAEQAGEAPA